MHVVSAAVVVIQHCLFDPMRSRHSTLTGVVNSLLASMKQATLLLQTLLSLYTEMMCVETMLAPLQMGKDNRLTPRRQSVIVCCDGADGDDSQESDGEDVEPGMALPPAASGGTAEVDSQQQAQNDSEADSEADSEEEGEEDDEGDGEDCKESAEHSLVATQ